MEVAVLSSVIVLLLVLFVVRVVWLVMSGSSPARSSTRSYVGVGFSRFADNYSTLEQVRNGLREAGVESCNLIIGIDFTKSNEWNGKKSFAGNSLHAQLPKWHNPYQETIAIIGEALQDMDDDQLIPAYGFGDSTTSDRSVFSLNPNHHDGVCTGFDEVLKYYTQVLSSIKLAGPTSFAPIIRKAIDIVRQSRAYHILLIIADGQVTARQQTIDAIVEASKYPLSIVMVGVGDGPWNMMETFDDELPQRRFDNFQFVDFEQIKRNTWELAREKQKAAFALAALMEIPDQFKAIQQLNLL